jgi:hypothetical protein
MAESREKGLEFGSRKKDLVLDTREYMRKNRDEKSRNTVPTKAAVCSQKKFDRHPHARDNT